MGFCSKTKLCLINNYKSWKHYLTRIKYVQKVSQSNWQNIQLFQSPIQFNTIQISWKHSIDIIIINSMPDITLCLRLGIKSLEILSILLAFLMKSNRTDLWVVSVLSRKSILGVIRKAVENSFLSFFFINLTITLLLLLLLIHFK